MSLFTDLLNGGGPSLDQLTESNDVFYELAYPESLPYMKTTTKQITLPKGDPVGKGNLCFLYAPTAKDSFALMKDNTNYLSGNHYYWYYYNHIYIGTLYNRKYRFKSIEERKKRYDAMEKAVPGVRPYIKVKVAETENRNMYYDLQRYIEIFYSFCDKLPPIKKITLYWDYLKKIVIDQVVSPKLTNRFILVNVDMYKMSKVLSENLRNPLFMIYYTLWKKPELLKEFDIDFFFYTGKKNLKVNPGKIENPSDGCKLLKQQMRKLYSYVPKEVMDTATDETEVQKQEVVDEAVDKVKEKMKAPEAEKKVIQTEEELKEISKETEEEQEIESKVKEKTKAAAKESEEILSVLKDEAPPDTIGDVVASQVASEINEDRDLISKIYDTTIAKEVPKRNFSTERDRKLKEAQKDLVVGKMTIKDIEKVQASKLNIPVKDVSKSVHTTNKNMTTLRFDNIEKTYEEKLMPKDITNAILSLNDKSIPMFVRKIDVKDTSDELNYKDTYTIYLEDANRQRHTVKVDIPKFIEGKFLYIGGNKKVIKKQSFLYPVVKTSEDTVQVVTNYNKMFIKRIATKSISSIERLKILLKKNDSVKKYFDFGSALFNNQNYITTVEYDELSKIALRFKCKSCVLYFDQGEARDVAAKKGVKIPKDHMFIGYDVSGKPCFIHEETQKTKDDKSIVQVIINALPADIVHDYETTSTPNRLMMANVTVMSKAIPIGILLGFWEGMESILKKAKIKYRLEQSLPKERKANEIAIRFMDCYLIYESDVKTDLVMNSFRLLDTRNIRISEMNDQEAFMPYVTKTYGRSAISNALMNVYEFMIDPITKEVLETLSMPTDLVSLVIYAVALLADSQYTTEIDQNLSRIRSAEIIPAILYDRLAKNYVTYRNSNGKKKFSVPQDCVIKELLAVKTVEDYSTLNPVLELDTIHGISARGFRGANLERSYDLPKRSYHESMTGTISPSTSPDGNTGISKTLSTEPGIINPRGFVNTPQDKKDMQKLKDVNLFSPAELLIPLAGTIDDSTRLGHAMVKKSKTVAVKSL